MSDSNKIYLWWVIMGVLFCTYPFVFNLILPLPSITFIMFVSFGVFFCLNVTRKVELYKPLVPIALLQILGTILSIMATGDWGYYKQILYIIWGIVIISFINKIGFRLFLFYYNRLILVVAILGVISSVLTIIMGARAFLEFTEMDGRDGWLVYFTFTNSNMGSLIRYAGIFDEPGAMATWGMFSLLLNKVYVKDDKIEIPLMISLLFTFSLAYIIQLSLYIFCFYIIKASMKVKILTLAVGLICISLFYIYMDKDSPIYMLTLGRLGIGSSVDFIEDNNRADLMIEAKKIFQSSPLFGVGTTRFYGGEYMADNPYETLAKDGIIGTIFLYLPLLKVLMYSRKHKELFFMVVILGIGYLQRPFHVNIFHYTMIYLVLISSLQISLTSKSFKS